MTKFYYLLLGCLFIFTFSLQAQEKCGAMQLHEDKLYKDPKYAKGWEQFQRQRIEWMNQAKSRTDNTNCQGGFKTIPVVVHYEYNPTSATERTCLINLANSQIAHMNQAYSGQLCQDASPTASSSGGCLQFVIANQNHPASANLADGQPAVLFGSTVCPNGPSSAMDTSISYIPCAIPEWKGYLNIVVKVPLGMLAGIANLPPTSSIDLVDGPTNSTNTIILGSCDFGVASTPCAANFVGGANCQGLSTTGGRTVTHEFGHFLGLPHTFCADRIGNPSNSTTNGSLPNSKGCEGQTVCGDNAQSGPGCDTNQCDCDGFTDTPPQAYSEYTAPCDAPGGVLPNPSTGTNYNYNNFMDYIADKCMTCFSTQQANQISRRARDPANNVKPNVFMDGNTQTCSNGQAMQTQGTDCNDGNANTMNDVIQADGCTCAGTPIMPTMNLCVDGTPKMAPGTPCGANNEGQIDTDSCACVAVMPPTSLCSDGFPKAAPGTDCSDGGPAAQIGADSCSCFFVNDGAPPIAGDGAENWCVDVAEFAGGDGQIIVSNLITEREIIQIIGAGTNWQEITICDGNCDDNQVIPNLTPGSYQVKLQMFESSDNSYCFREVTIEVTGLIVDSGGDDLDCNNVLLSTTDNQIDVGNLAPVSIVKVYLVKPNGSWELKGSCSGDCGDSKSFSNLSEGNYIVTIEFFNADYNGKICDSQMGIIVGNGIANCPDGTLKTNPGTACNDGNDNTINDRIQADSCTCLGEPIGNEVTNCNNITITTVNGRIRVGGLDAPIAQVKLYKVNANGGWELVDNCNAGCGPEKTFSNLASGNYIVDVVLYTANYSNRICGLNQSVTLGGTLNSSAQNRSIQLLEFAAFQKKRTVQLQWLTNTGYKNAYYVLEKSTNGKDFQPLTTIKNEAANMDLQSFIETDNNPFIGANYYRMKQSYQNGSFDYTPIQQVNFDWDVNAVQIFPNPAREMINIDLTKFNNKKAKISIVDILGKIYVEKTIEKSSEHLLQIPTNSLNNGIYYVSIKIGQLPAVTKKILVNRWY